MVYTVNIDGFSMRYLKFGSGGKQMVIIPGLSVKRVTDSYVAIERAYAAFSQKYTVYLFDRRENIEAGYNASQAADDTAKAMIALGICDSFIFGVSQGGMIAQYLAIDYPSLVKKIVLGSTFSRSNNIISGVVSNWKKYALEGNTEKLAESMVDSIYSDRTLARYRQFLVSSFKELNREELERFCILVDLCKGCSTYDRLEKIHCPMLVIGACMDRVTGPDATEEIAIKTGCEKFIYKDYGHAVYDEAPDYKKRVLDFFDSVPVWAADESDIAAAKMIAKATGSYSGIRDKSKIRGLSLFFANGTLSLTDGMMELCGDFSELKKRVKNGMSVLRRESLVKAAMIKGNTNGVTVFDATAGLGEDSFILAASGFNVVLFEKNNVIFELLQNAYERGVKDSEISPILGRMTLIKGDSTQMLQLAEVRPDVVFLDPMFPQRRKSGKIKKKFQLLQQLEEPCVSEKDLIDAAIDAKPVKIIIKRPENGEFLAGIRPSYSIKGETIRYDCIVHSNE